MRWLFDILPCTTLSGFGICRQRIQVLRYHDPKATLSAGTAWTPQMHSLELERFNSWDANISCHREYSLWGCCVGWGSVTIQHFKHAHERSVTRCWFWGGMDCLWFEALQLQTLLTVSCNLLRMTLILTYSSYRDDCATQPGTWPVTGGHFWAILHFKKSECWYPVRLPGYCS